MTCRLIWAGQGTIAQPDRGRRSNVWNGVCERVLLRESSVQMWVYRQVPFCSRPMDIGVDLLRFIHSTDATDRSLRGVYLIVIAGSSHESDRKRARQEDEFRYVRLL